MGSFVSGDVVVLSFPFSNFQGSKSRPALILASLVGHDLIVCQITGQTRNDGYSISLLPQDFSSGSLNNPSSNIRPNHLFTVDPAVIKYVAGHLKDSKLFEAIDGVIKILRP